MVHPLLVILERLLDGTREQLARVSNGDCILRIGYPEVDQIGLDQSVVDVTSPLHSMTTVKTCYGLFSSVE
jgi:hypothetical protein